MRTTRTRWPSTSCTITSPGCISRFRCSPATAAGVTKTLMDLGGMVEVLEAWEAAQPKAKAA